MALGWAAALLREADRQHQGLDLFGRDAFLLGRLLVTLGALCCAVLHHALLCSALLCSALLRCVCRMPCELVG